MTEEEFDFIQVNQALNLTADEIVKNNIHFTDPKANLISVNKVAKSGVKACERLLKSFEENEEPKKKWWEFWK